MGRNKNRGKTRGSGKSRLPQFYGWFMNQRHSEHLLTQANNIYRDCQRTSPEFAGFVSEMTNLQGLHFNLRQVYRRGAMCKQSAKLHCTSYYSSHGQARGAYAYSSRREVRQCMGQPTCLEIIGFVFSHRTVGARVRLDGRQLTLWNQDDAAGRRGGRGPFWGGQTHQYRPVTGRGSRAHLTLGFTSGSQAKHTGLDLVQVVWHEESNEDEDDEENDDEEYDDDDEYEDDEENNTDQVDYDGPGPGNNNVTQSRSKFLPTPEQYYANDCNSHNDDYDDDDEDWWEIESGVLQLYDDKYWVVYLNEPIHAQATFSAKY